MTKTVSGFMDFVTTVGNTVMVFTPQAGPSKTGKLGSNHLSSLFSIITQLRKIRTVSVCGISAPIKKGLGRKKIATDCKVLRRYSKT